MYLHAVPVSAVAFSHQFVAALSLWTTSADSWPFVSMDSQSESFCVGRNDS